jgi:hypothetical protein
MRVCRVGLLEDKTRLRTTSTPLTSRTMRWYRRSLSRGPHHKERGEIPHPRGRPGQCLSLRSSPPQATCLYSSPVGALVFKKVHVLGPLGRSDAPRTAPGSHNRTQIRLPHST